MISGKLFRWTSAAVALSAAAMMTGCGVGPVTTSSSGTMQIRGNVIGGQQPVSASTIKLYAAGKTGNGSAGASMLVLPVQTDANGNFSITADYVCSSSSDQVLLVAQGGNPGLSGTINNSALVLVDAVGTCGNLPTTQFVTINELTTAAAAWALAPFFNANGSVNQLGTTATNAQGLANGFLNAQLLADPYFGGAAVLPANLTVETGKLYALGNALASCVNTSGPANCAALFAAATPPGGTAPVNTWQAALDIVRNPGNNVTAVYNTASATAPFPQTLSQAPNDWTMTMTVTGGGLTAPTSVALDVNGNVWVAGYNGVLSEFSAQGKPLSGNGYGLGTLSEAFGLTVDLSNNVWVSVEEQPHHSPTRGSIAKFLGSSSGSPGTLVGSYYDSSIDYPVALSTDTAGNIFVADYANSTASVYNSSGQVLQGGVLQGNAAFPVAIAADNAHGMWLANQGDRTVSYLKVVGGNSTQYRTTCCNGANGIAVDAQGNAWVANYFGTSMSEVSSNCSGTTCTVPLQGITGGGISYPSGVAIDGGQDVWVTNYRGTSISKLAGNANASAAAGTPLSPAYGYGQDVGLLLPYGLAIDATGDVWVSNFSKDNMVMFFGLGTPTAAPLSPTPAVP